jgi:uncharacterized protein YgiM (DUF1202 family)
MRKRGAKDQGKKNLRIIYTTLFILVVGWFVISIIKKENPLKILKGGFSKLSDNSTLSLQDQLAEKDSIIAELESRLAAYEGNGISRRALVIINSETLNMRQGPSLESNIIQKIPANSEVRLMYYDTNTYYIEGESGKWAHIVYAGQEGWVWGNYIREI